jgi:hypothetical protein
MFLMPTGSLFLMRTAIIFWSSLAVWPMEFVFDRIDDELTSRGHHVFMG